MMGTIGSTEDGPICWPIAFVSTTCTCTIDWDGKRQMKSQLSFVDREWKTLIGVLLLSLGDLKLNCVGLL